MENCFTSYNDIIGIVALKEMEEITFKHPFPVYKPTLQNGVSDKDYEIIPNKGFRLNIYDALATATAEFTQSNKHANCNVVVEYNLDSRVGNLKEAESELVKILNNNYILLLTHFGGNQSIIRTLPHGWLATIKDEAGVMKVTLSANNTSGIQRIHT